MSRVGLFAMTFLLASSAAALARPTDVIHPGGVPSASDTLVIEYPVLRSPSLLSLSAPSALAGPSVASATLVRREDPSGTLASTPSAPAGAPQAGAQPGQDRKSVV